jgi:thiol-disulfide isomerase/thioredoxin
MNRKFYFLLCSLLLIISSCIKTDRDIIDKTISKLNSLETLEFEQRIQILQKDMQMNQIDSAYCFFDFKSMDTLIGSKYQIIHREGEQVFNGMQNFFSNVKEENVIFNDNPTSHEVSSSIFFMNSVYVLRKLLPEMIIDTSVIFTRKNDTIINSQNCYSFSVKMKNKWINPNIGHSITESNLKSYNYLLKIYKNTFLPAQFETIYPNAKGSWKSTFSNLKLDTDKGDSIWSYERFPKRFLRISKKDYFEALKTKTSINVGLAAPVWTLPMIKGDSIRLKEINGLVLLEFWFPYCRGCVQAVPYLNQIQKQFQDKGLKIYGIEFNQTNETALEEYIEKQKIEYPTLYNGKQVSKEYGVNAAPTFILIDKKGIIIYTSLGFNRDELINKIKTEI